MADKFTYDYFLSGVPERKIPLGQEKEAFMLMNSIDEPYIIIGYQIKYNPVLKNSRIKMKDGGSRAIIDGETPFCQLGSSTDAAIPLDVVPFRRDFPHGAKLIITLLAVEADINENDFSLTLFLERKK